MALARPVVWTAILVALIGAVAGLCLGWVLHLTGLPLLGTLLLLAAAIGSTFLRQAVPISASPFFARARRLRLWIRLGLVVLIVGITLVVQHSFNFNPRDYAYAPFLLTVVISALLFGFAASIFAVLLCSVATAYFYAPPVYSLVIAEWHDAVGIAAFAFLGGLCGLVLKEFFDLPD